MDFAFLVCELSAAPANDALELNAHSCIGLTFASTIDVGDEHQGVADNYRKKPLRLVEASRHLGPFPAVASAQR